MSSKSKHRHKEKDRGIETKNLAPVNEAVKDYRVIEDGAYAYHLQNEEIENHYSQNVNMRRTVMEDIRRAKELQDEEDRKARILTLDEEKEVKQMDEELAEMIQEEIFQKSVIEEQERKDREERDQELAMLMEERERRRAERSKRALEQDHAIATRLQNLNVTPSLPNSRDERRIRLMSDEELAKRFQEEEKLKLERTKKRKEELQSVVEMQDEELAKYIHEREVEAAEMRFRKGRGKRMSKKKGKYEDEPLYYDDNVNPPTYHDHPPPYEEPRKQSLPGGHPLTHQEPSSRKNNRRPDRPPPPQFSESHKTEIKVPLDSSQQSNRTISQHHESHDRQPAKRYNGHSSQEPKAHQSRSEKDRRRRGSADDLDGLHRHNDRPNHRHSHDDRRPREHMPRSHHKPDKGRSQDGGYDRKPHSHHDGSSEAHRHQVEQDRVSPQNNAPVPKPRGGMHHSKSMPEPDLDDDLHYDENFAQLTEEELWQHNNNIPLKGGRKKEKKGECKQQ